MELDLNLQKELISAIAALNGQKSWIESSATIALVSGLIAILGGLLTHYFNIYSEKSRQESASKLKQLESDIRKQENIHERQLEALLELSKISHHLQPTIWSHPEYTSDEAYSDVVFSMSGLLDKLAAFLTAYSYLMPNEIITQINVVMFKCNSEHWGASLSETPDYEPTKDEIDAAKTVLDFLNAAVIDFKKYLGVTNA